MRLSVPLIALALVSSSATAALAPEDYARRVADQYRAAMQDQDYARDGVVTREEARPNLLLDVDFNDIDIDGEGRITQEEMDRFLGALPDNPFYM